MPERARCGRPGSWSGRPSAPRHGRRPAGRAIAREARARRLAPRSSASRSRGCAGAPGALTAAELRAAEAAYADGDGARSCRRSARPRDASCRASSSGPRVVDRAGWVRANTSAVRRAHRPPRGRPARPDHAAGRRARQGHDRARQPLGHDPPARAAARVHGPARAGPVRPRAALGRGDARAGCCSSRRTSARPRRTLGVPLEPFRTWIALHETTHAFEFEAHPWLRPYLAERLERQLTLFSATPSSLGRDAMRGARARRSAARAADEHWMERLMTDEQRPLFRETQAVMSLLEGFSDYVMDEVGRGPRPRRRADQRPLPRAARAADAVRAGDPAAHRHGPEDGAVPRRAFVAGHRATARGPAALRRLWDGPETLPTRGEIEAPERWIARVDGPRPASERGGMTDGADAARRVPARGPGGVPTAIALTPDPVGPLPGRRPRARSGPPRPGRGSSRSRSTGLADGAGRRRRGPAPRLAAADAFDRLLARAPRPALGPLGDGRRRARPDARRPRARARRSRTPAACSRGPIAEYVLMMILAVSRAPAAAPRAAARADVAAARGRASCAT